MKRKKLTRWIAALLAASILIGDCGGSLTVQAAETATEQSSLQEASDDPAEEDDTASEAIAEAESTEETPEVLFEVEELRDLNSKQYRLTDGTILAAQYGMDVHYQDEDGRWTDIDNRFYYEPETDKDGMEGYATAEGAVDFKFAPDVQDGEVLRVSSGDYTVGFELLGTAGQTEAASVSETEVILSEEGEAVSEATEAKETAVSSSQITFLKGEVLNPEAAEAVHLEDEAEEAAVEEAAEGTVEEVPEVAWVDVTSPEPQKEAEAVLLEQMKVDNAVTSVGYGNVLPGISLQYVVSGSSVKEYIVVGEKQDAYSYVFEMNLGNLEPEVQTDGSIRLKDPKKGLTVYEIPAGYMTDAAGESSDAVTMEAVLVKEGTYLFKVTADAEWINAEERVLPVQIDPTLSYQIDSLADVAGCYVCSGRPTASNLDYGNMMVGYDSSGNGRMRTYIQLKNLAEVPKDSVICGAKFYFGIASYSHVAMEDLYVQVREVTEDTDWEEAFTWNSQPAHDSTVLDYQKVSAGMVPTSSGVTCVGWNITELVKKHYEDSDTENHILSFLMEGRGDAAMASQAAKANAGLLLTRDTSTAYPILQIVYRDTKGVEDYYTYQTQSLGNAGTGSVGDYNGQLTIIKPVASYESTIMSYGLNLVYNSALSNKYFTNNGKDIHTKSFSNMILGKGWKLSAQETVVSVTVTAYEDGENTPVTWLVYNDSDGTEHYFKQKSSGSSIYEDEDGLGLTIEKSGSTYTMKDQKDNKKIFVDGYLETIQDANGNQILINYNSSRQITSISSKPKGSSTAKTIFALDYDATSKLLTEITYNNNSSIKYRLTYETGQNGYELKTIQHYDPEKEGEEAWEIAAKYGYNPYPLEGDSSNRILSYAVDAENESGVQYDYTETATGWRIGRIAEYYIESKAQQYGNIVTCTASELRKTVYTDQGLNKNDVTDDITTAYLFNSSGHTINASSRDNGGRLLGVTAAAYTKNSGTSKKNNRITESISSGQAGVSFLKNGGFESSSTDGAADHWTALINAPGNVARRTADPLGGNAHYNLYNESSSYSQSLYQTVSLTAGWTYTASAWVNTSGMAQFYGNDGVYLKFTNSSGTQLAKSDLIDYKTSDQIEGGWQRISVTYKPTTTGTYRLYLVLGKGLGLTLADNVQLELSPTASAFNYIEDGGFENSSGVWTTNSSTSIGSYTTISGARSARAVGEPGTDATITQTFALNRSSNTTFLLSAWSKADSVPELTTDKTSTDSMPRYWGIHLTLNYSDGTSEKHYLSFSDYIREWQYGALSVTPETADKTLSTAKITLRYENNANTAYFDSISLIEEPAQTYKYNDEGELVSVKSSGNGEESYQYNSDQNLIKMNTEGSGTYTYEYNNTANKHLPTSIINDTIAMDVAYDSYGQTTGTVLRNTTDSWTMTSSSAYSDGLLTQTTDNTGAVTKYTYEPGRQLNSVESPNGNKQYTNYSGAWRRPSKTYQMGVASIDYGYTDGRLSTMVRGGYIPGNTTKQNQTYSFSYDGFGNRTETLVGNRTLAVYNYQDGNGNLTDMTYGPATGFAAKVYYTYDNLDRMTDVIYHDKNSSRTAVYGYAYGADGNLTKVTEGASKTPVYTYDYDSLGRLIRSRKLENGQTVLYTNHEYDTSDRITEQSWQMGSDSFREAYTYSTKDGTLGSMTITQDVDGTEESSTLTFDYDNLKRLKRRNMEHVVEEYDYLEPKNTVSITTSQLAGVIYKKPGTSTSLLPTLSYTYDAEGNIKTIKSGTVTAAEYTYDSQNQLTEETLRYGNTAENYQYTYDTYGNIRSSYLNLNGAANSQYTFSYENAQWLDLLTKVSYKALNGTTTTRSLTYDAIGNPLTYFNGLEEWNFTWSEGRRLKSAVTADGETTITNTYDVDGIRETKQVGDVVHNYVTLDGKVIRESYGTTTIDYLYDNDGRPYQITVDLNGTKYVGYYVLNQQGDVIALVDEDGAVVTTYVYNAWGKVINYSTSGDGSKLYTYNALTYRGYYYDKDLEMYYLNSRYYDPQIGRFISADTADVLTVDATALTDKNLYAYCDNNPIVRKDSGGTFWLALVKGVGTQYVSDVINNMLEGKTGVDILQPTSSIGEYFAAGVTALIPGSGFGGALIRNIVTEGILSAEHHIKGDKNTLVKSVKNIVYGTATEIGVGYVTTKFSKYVSSKMPKNYSSYAGVQYKKYPGITRQQIEQKMSKTFRWGERISNGFDLSINVFSNVIS